MTFKNLSCISVSLILNLLWVSRAAATECYVDQNHANASDQNPGTEQQPWKTLTHACQTAKEGDVVWVKAGTYRETITPANNGVAYQAFGDDAAVIAPPQGILIDPSSWEKVPDRQKIYQCKVDVKDKTVHVDGLAVQFEQVQGIKLMIDPSAGTPSQKPVDRRLEDGEARRWTTPAEGILQINLDGENPAKHRVELCPAEFIGIRLKPQIKGVTVRGFEIIDATIAIHLDGEKNIIEDCVVRGAEEAGGMAAGGHANIVRRCSFIQCWSGLGAGGKLGGHVIEGNFIIGTGQPVLRNRPPQVGLETAWGPRCTLRFSNVNFCVARYNIMADGVWAAWWPDVNCYGNYFYGNTIWHIPDRGIYNEYPSNDSRIFYNAITHCDDGITFRFCWHTMTMYNYLSNIKNTALAYWGPHHDAPYLFDNVCAKNLATNSRIYLALDDHRGLEKGLPKGWPGEGKISDPARYRMFSNLVSDNLYRGEAKQCFAEFNGVRFSSLEEFQKDTGMERGSRINADAKMEDLALGLYTVRVPESARPDETAQMVGNPVRQGVHTDPLPMASEDAPYFWTQGLATALPGGEWTDDSPFAVRYESREQPVRRMILSDPGADPSQPLAPDANPNVWLQIIPQKLDKLPPAGTGFWSPSLPTLPDAKIIIRFQVQGDEVKPASDDGGAIALVRFQSLTGQHVTTQIIFGKDKDGKWLGGEPVVGKSPWRKVQATVDAPQTAKRFALFLGMRQAQGSIRYGDIWIDTAPGTPMVQASPKTERYEHVNLEGFMNHDLDTDMGAPAGAPPADEFARDYCDLPLIDLSKVKAGEYQTGKLRFVVQRAISLRNFRRPPPTLPLAVDGIPVGKEVSSLYFLHPGPMQMGAQEYWRYVIHYTDGQVIEVVPVDDMTYVRYRQPYFLPDAKEVEGAVRLAESVPDVGAVFCWTNPRPSAKVHSVDFRSMDAGQAVLLGITAGLSQ